LRYDSKWSCNQSGSENSPLQPVLLSMLQL
jgi:hypothetical protein